MKILFSLHKLLENLKNLDFIGLAAIRLYLFSVFWVAGTDRLNSFEEFLSPSDSIKKIGPGLEFFYSDGDFTMDVPGGKSKILIERGTEYEPLYLDLMIPSSGILQKEIRLKKWTLLGDLGWHPGNTHILYDQNRT